MARGYFLLLAFVGLITTSSLQAEKPLIVIDKKARIDVYVAPISGGQGAEATRVLENDLQMADSFNLVAQDAAAYVIKGQLTGDGVSGNVTQKDGTTAISKNFSGSWRPATHLFADAIVEKLTGTPGFASSKVTFISSHSGSKEVFTMDIDGANVHQLSNDKVLSLGPKFSYDGKKIAYTSYKSHFPDVWVIDLFNSKRNRVAFFPGLNSQPAFSPNGSTLALILSKDGNTELYTIAAEGGSPQRLTTTRGTEASPVWSPTGDQIAYVSDDRGSAQIFTMPATGGTPTRLKTVSSTSPYATEPDWSPDGKKIAYSVRINGTTQIGATNLETQDTMLLTDSGRCETPSWTHDSRHLLYSSHGTLYLLDSLTKKSIQIKNGLTQNSEPNCTR